ncbi:MAG: ankyrin repeat domain-containing protein [Thermoanaerobaculia bacterium]
MRGSNARLRLVVFIIAGVLLAAAAAASAGPDRELVAAVENGDLTAVGRALAADADPDARKTERKADWAWPTVLMLAAAADRADMVAALLAAGADPEAEDAVGATAVMWAVTRRANDALAVLVRAGADVRGFQGGLSRPGLGRNPLLAALAYHNEDAVALLIEGGADVDAQGGELRVQSPLMLAVERGYPWAVRWLLDAGADADARREDDGRTALDIAVEGGHTQLAALLEARGAHRSSATEPPPAAYLPPAGFEVSPQLSADALSWSYLVLQRMGEPGLCERFAVPAPGTPDRGTPDRGESFRFLWIRTFDEPLMVRVDGRANGSAVLTAAILDGQGGYEFGLPGHRVTRVVKPRRWRAFRELVEAAAFWQLPAVARPFDAVVLDGASWALEGRRNGGCHVVWRYSPAPDGPWADFRRLCRMLLDLAKLGSTARPVY